MKFDSPVNAVPVGIMHIVDEIRQKKPNAIIATNAILPENDIINSTHWDIIKQLMYTWERFVNGLDDKNVHFHDSFRVFFDTSTQNTHARFHVGKYHLNKAGYDRWATAIVEWTKKTLDIDLTEWKNEKIILLSRINFNNGWKILEEESSFGWLFCVTNKGVMKVQKRYPDVCSYY